MARGDLNQRDVDVERLLDALGIAFKRDRRELKAICPFHVERKPSWSIRSEPGSEKNGLHSCFSCGAGGGVIALVMQVLGLDAETAQFWVVTGGLASGGGIGRLELRMIDPMSSTTSGLAMPPGARFAPLSRWPTMPRRYAEGRGLDAAQVERWGVGYAVDGALAGRLVMPVRDEAGVLSSYEARSYIGRTPKYLRPSLASGLKRWSIFGAARWQEAGYGVVVVTEGVLNALACERAGAPAVAALCGSKLAPEHVLELGRFGRVVIATDPDSAGAKAALGIYASLARWKDVAIAKLPTGKDCADLDSGTLAGILWRR